MDDLHELYVWQGGSNGLIVAFLKLVDDLDRNLAREGFVNWGKTARLTRQGIVPITNGAPKLETLLPFDRLKIRNRAANIALYGETDTTTADVVLWKDEPKPTQPGKGRA